MSFASETPKRKLKLCRGFLNGTCTYEKDKCHFAHGSSDLNEIVELCDVADCKYGNKCTKRHLSISSESDVVDDSKSTTSSTGSQINPEKYKMCLCKNFFEGKCTFGNSCCFAHGSCNYSESIPLCSKGMECTFGLKCRFRHMPYWKNIDTEKSKICMGFTYGNCRNTNCKFAHGSLDYGASVPECNSLKTTGVCAFGDYCTCSHKIDYCWQAYPEDHFDVSKLNPHAKKSYVDFWDKFNKELEEQDNVVIGM